MFRPDPFTFDPVRFPGLAPGEEWPPEAFDFSAPWLRHRELAFEVSPRPVADPDDGAPFGPMRS